MDWWDQLYTRIILNTSETYASLEKAPLSYVMKLSEALDMKQYAEDQLQRAKAEKEQQQQNSMSRGR